MAGPEFNLGTRNDAEEKHWRMVGESFTGMTSRSDAAAGAIGQSLEQIVTTAQAVGLHLAEVLKLDPSATAELMEPILRAVDKVDVALATGEAMAVNTLAEAISNVGELLAVRLSGNYDIDEFGFDAHFQEKVWLPIWRPFFENWFRVEVIGAENIPSDGSALIVSNHAGVLPMDGMMTMVAVHDHAGRNLRMLAADLAMGVPVVAPIARRVGATLANAADAESLLTSNEIVAVWPEGFKGLGKPFGDRYRLQRFGRGGFVSTAVAAGAPIIPLSVVGSEEIYPKIGEVPARAAVHADHADVPAHGSARRDAAADEVDHGIRQADRDGGIRPRCRRRPNGRLRDHRPGARDDPEHALPQSCSPRQRLLRLMTGEPVRPR